MKIITSFGTRRVKRQQECLASWLMHDHAVTAVQTISRPTHAKTYLAKMRKAFPGVEFVLVADKPNPFGRPTCPPITSMVRLIENEPALVVNSDIEIASEFDHWGEVPGNTLRVGIRHDQAEDGSLRLRKYGIDVFEITPAMVEHLPDIGFAFGCPVWDYWVVYALSEAGFKVSADHNPIFLHEEHTRAWDDKAQSIGVEIMRNRYGIRQRDLTQYILRETNRFDIAAATG
ncbi:hypothetical protein [Rosistilla oblonga]|uniref:hypothetical protein n=1 Tax=Rosistilla oblonga TaxID=2527990 RepID=UPI003A977DA4